MKTHGRPRKRYGPIHGRGRAGPRLPQWAKDRNARREAKGPPATYRVPAGARCEVRKAGEKAWRPHTTREPVECVGFLWRNRTHYGLPHGAWELKVRVGQFATV
jgi:hypothetical protein